MITERLAGGLEISTSKAAIAYVEMETFQVSSGPSFGVDEIAREAGHESVGKKGYLTTDSPKKSQQEPLAMWLQPLKRQTTQ